MPDKRQDLIDHKLQDLDNDGVDRRGIAVIASRSFGPKAETARGG